jgi:hypothetical protein
MQPYRILALEKTTDIPNLPSLTGKWYRYLISNGMNQITGYRCGTLSEVKEYLNNNIKRLNQKYDLRNRRQGFNKSFTKPCHLGDYPLHS